MDELAECEPPLALGSLPTTVKEKSPSEPVEPDAVLTVRVALAPPEVGTFDTGEKEKVASEGSPRTVNASAGIVPVDPATSLRVTV